MALNELGPDYVERYCLLHKYKKIGIIWSTGAVCFKQNIGDFPDRGNAFPIQIEVLKAQIDFWFPRIEEAQLERKPVEREYQLIRRKYYE